MPAPHHQDDISFYSPSRPHFFGLCGLLRCLCSVLGLLSLALRVAVAFALPASFQARASFPLC